MGGGPFAPWGVCMQSLTPHLNPQVHLSPASQPCQPSSFKEKKLLIELGSSYFNYEVKLFMLGVLPEPRLER